MAPLSLPRADQLVRFLADGLSSRAQPTVLDVGCGWGELLLKVLRDAPSAAGIGLDSDPSLIEHARCLAQQGGFSYRAHFAGGDARTQLPASVDAVICIGASQIWGPTAADDGPQPLDYTGALEALRGLVPRGGQVLYGECIWSRPPTPEAIAPLAGRVDEYVSLATLLDIAVDCGFAPIRVHEANQDEWDEFESGYAARFARWLAAHEPDHPDSAHVRERAAPQRSGYVRGYRGILGFAYVGLIAV